VAGIVKTIFCIRTWDFSGLQAGAGNAEEFCVLKDFPVGGYREGTILVRVHDADIVNGSSQIEVRAVETAPCVEDPATDFEGSELASAPVQGASEPQLVAANFTAPFGRAVTVYVKGTQGSATTNVTAKLSAVLVLKE
jgi:hypothetical protein